MGSALSTTNIMTLLLLLWIVQLVNVEIVLTVSISIDGDGRINIIQAGSVPLPSGTSNGGLQSFDAVFNRASNRLGAQDDTPYTEYILNAGAQASFGCVSGSPPVLDTRKDINTVVLAVNGAGTLLLELLEGYDGTFPLDGSTTSTDPFDTLSDAGFVEGGTCFVEYDTDGDSNTGDANGNDARIEWNVGLSPSSMPSNSPSLSSAPSFTPSDSPSESRPATVPVSPQLLLLCPVIVPVNLRLLRPCPATVPVSPQLLHSYPATIPVPHQLLHFCPATAPVNHKPLLINPARIPVPHLLLQINPAIAPVNPRLLHPCPVTAPVNLRHLLQCPATALVPHLLLPINPRSVSRRARPSLLGKKGPSLLERATVV